MTLSRRILLVVAAVVGLGLLPAAASAATVSVEETTGSFNQATLRYAAAPGETNQVTVTLGPPTTTPGIVTLEVTDKGAPLQTGASCTGGGLPGVSALCRIHAPRGAEFAYCGRDCQTSVPGSEWRDSMAVELGDGDDSFDGSSLTAQGAESWSENVNGGAGADTISTGGGKDTITPGPGNDVVHSGLAEDRVIAEPTPDGNDLLDLGTDAFNAVDYSARTEPLHLAGGVLGGAGEEDRLQGANVIIGGSGNDSFVSSGPSEWLRGGPGDDTLVGSQFKDFIYGGPGNDTIRGEGGEDFLYGGEGNDTVEGGAGNDFIEEREEGPTGGEVLATGLKTTGGTDKLNGGEGDDYVLAGFGNDEVEGGPGNDRIFGEAGNDTIEGGPGDDEIAGEAGVDVLDGGEGDDTVLAGRIDETTSRASEIPVDASSDKVDCGAGDDTAQANGWDQVQNCETRKTVRAVRVGQIRRNHAGGSARVAFQIAGDGALHVTGAGVHPVGRKIELGPGFTDGITASTFAVRAIGPTRKQLRARGHVTVVLRLSWQPEGQGVVAETRKLRLTSKKAHPKKSKRKPGAKKSKR
jgi:Ca2+-binding RTX toxin-like protein